MPFGNMLRSTTPEKRLSLETHASWILFKNLHNFQLKPHKSHRQSVIFILFRYRVFLVTQAIVKYDFQKISRYQCWWIFSQRQIFKKY